MQFTVKTDEINYGLSMVIRALAARPVKQIYEGILVETGEDSLSLTCTDGDITVRARVPAQIEEDGRAILPGKLFADLMRYQTVGQATVKMDEKGRLQIRSGNTVSNMISMDGDEYPEIDDILSGNEVYMNCSRFKEAVSRVLFAVSADDSRKILTGVLMEVYPEETVVVGLDGFRLAIQRIQQKNTLSEKKPDKISCVIPGKIINEVGRMLPDDEEEEVRIIFSSGRIMFSFGEVKVYASLLTGEFIDYQRILPKTWTTEISVRRDEISDSIDRCNLIAREGKNNLIHFSIRKEGEMELSANAEIGEVVDRVGIRFEGNELSIAFNAKYLMDVIHNIPTERMIMCFNTNVSPCVVRPEEGREYTFLVLPVRIFGK